MGLQIPAAHLELYNSGSNTEGKSATAGLQQSSQAFSCDRSKTGSQVGKDETFSNSGTAKQLWPADEVRTAVRVEHDPAFHAETGSHESDGSEQMIIRQTRGWDVRSEGY